MGVNKNPFKTPGEQASFQKLSRQWGGTYRIYPSLPFLNVFNTKNLIDLSQWPPTTISISKEDEKKLDAAKIDFTLCGADDKPLVCIEFDELNEGWNVGKEYRSELEVSPWRKELTETKLTVAHGSFFPYFVIAPQYFEDIGGLELTIVDGVIGEVLAKRATHDRLSQPFTAETVGMTDAEFEALPESEKREVIQDYVWGAEIQSTLDHNPIARTVAKLEEEIGGSCSERPLIAPGVDPEKVEERARAMEKSPLLGVEVTVKTNDGRTQSARVRVPRFDSPYFIGVSLVTDIAKLIALKKLRESSSPSQGQSEAH